MYINVDAIGDHSPPGGAWVLTAARSHRAAALPLVRALVDHLTRSARAIEARTGVTNAQLFVLRQLALAGPLSINELAARVHARQNAVSVVVRRLVQAGLVRRSSSPEDRRRVVVSLTPRGRRLESRAPRPPAEMLVHALDALPPRDAAALVRGLRALVIRMRLRVADAPLLFEHGTRDRSSGR